ncbi:tail fiber protein [Sphingomonas sp. AOB5]|uniref:phage tail protein n=1 Tax=Sphingomonas sp. AOB5 TaxID=3034017 RepID=UPI0023F62410|nr:tail fiber protein [Sphingomonas sp. AOB5]MDF7777503.1 tail fiber protein [Sphingomonas sp. AOB5]
MEPYLGEIRLFSGTTAPTNWAFCDGSALSRTEHELLFELIGTSYGSSSADTFNLPNLVERIALGAGQGPGLTSRARGDTGGANTTTLTVQNMRPHTHPVAVFPNVANVENPVGAALGAVPDTLAAYVPLNAVTGYDVMAPATVASGPAAQPVQNRMPGTRMTFIICLNGIHPTF